MRALDLFVEKNCGDKNVDLKTSRLLSREINGITLRQWIEQSRSLSTHDKVSIASASVALGCPFFLMSLGALFAVFDECDDLRINRQLQELYDKEHQLGGRLKASLDLTAVQSTDTLRYTVLPASIMSMDISCARGNKRAKQPGDRKGQALFSSGRRRDYNCRFLVEDKRWLATSKVLKQKHFLQGQFDRVNGKADFSLIAGIKAEIEHLEKELKRLGC